MSATINVAFLTVVQPSAISAREFPFLMEHSHICRLPSYRGHLTKAAVKEVQAKLEETQFPFASYYSIIEMDFIYFGNTTKYTDEELQQIMEISRKNFHTKYLWTRAANRPLRMTVPMIDGDYKMHWSITPSNRF